uniref:Uncharacterized protein n=1 Tax=Rhinolophus ferrumequinum TaxID=59479 RepID=A0A671EWI0_RHIFE
MSIFTTGRLYSPLFLLCPYLHRGRPILPACLQSRCDGIYEHTNQGKLWNHIKHRYENR